jgi:hypothetical protein
MKKPFWILGIIGAIGVYVVVGSVRGTTTTPTTDAGGSPAARPPEPPSDGRAPKAVVDVSEHDFGTCDPMEQGSHTFLVRNEGDAPLEIKKGPASCKCTLVDFPARAILPGETGRVRVSWTATTKYLLFNQQAAVLTNDPEHPSLAFRIKGEVRAHLLAEPEEIVFSNLSPGEVQTRSLTLFSQAWNAFEIRKIKASSTTFTWKVKPAPADVLAEVKAHSGYVVEVTSPREQPTGHFQETLSFYVSSKAQPDQERVCHVVITGNRASWLHVSGQGADGTFEVNLGQVPLGQGFKRRLTLLVRDINQKLRIQHVETNPSYLQAALTRARGEDVWCNVYYLDLEVPRDAPVCTYLSGEKGAVRIYADDPKLPAVSIAVAFAVVAEEPLGP